MSSTLTTPATMNMDRTNGSGRTRGAHHDSLKHNRHKKRRTTTHHQDHLDPEKDNINTPLVIDLVTNYFLKQECDQSHVRIRSLQEQIERAKDAIHRGFVHKHYEKDDDGEVRLRWSEGTEEYRQFQFEQEDKEQMMVLITGEFLKQRETILDELKYVEETRKHLQQAFNL